MSTFSEIANLLKRSGRHKEARQLVEADQEYTELKAHTKRVEKEWKQRYYNTLRLLYEELGLSLEGIQVQPLIAAVRELRTRPIALNFNTDLEPEETKDTSTEGKKSGKSKSQKRKGK